MIEFVMIIIFSIVSILLICQAQDLKQVTEPLNHVEGPHWDADQNFLYYTDITSRLVVRFDPKTGERTQVYIAGGDISPVLTVAGTKDQFVVGRGRDLITFRWDGNHSDPTDVRVLATVDEDRPRNKFNDGKADSRGRIWAGTIEEDGESGNAALYLFERDQNYMPLKKASASTSNGLAWNDKDSLMYYIDSPTTNVDIFDFNPNTTEISNRRTLFSTVALGLNGVPDGMTLDANGNLWVAVWGAGVVAHIDARTGRLIQRIDLPAKQVSSCVWGGSGLDTLYITTSRQGLSDQDLQQTPLAGAVFALTNTGVKGQETNKVRLSGAQLRQVTDTFQHLESPHWDPVLGVLYFVDKTLGLIMKYDPKTGVTSQTSVGGGDLGPILTVEGSNDTFVAGRGRDLIKFQWDGSGATKNITVLTSVEPNIANNSFYTGKADSRGRIWIGTYSADGTENNAGLYLIDPSRNFTVTKRLNVTKSNGMEWNKSNDRFFYVDTPTDNVDLFSYDSQTGDIGGRDHFYNTKNSTYFGTPSVPGGLTLDQVGNIWLATSTETAGVVANINITNREHFFLAYLSPKLVTSLAWGGDALDVLYVTTSRLGITDGEMGFWRGSGALFSYSEMGATGAAPYKVRLP